MRCPTGEYSLTECDSFELDYVELVERADHMRVCSLEIHSDKLEFRAMSVDSGYHGALCSGKQTPNAYNNLF